MHVRIRCHRVRHPHHNCGDGCLTDLWTALGYIGESTQIAWEAQGLHLKDRPDEVLVGVWDYERGCLCHGDRTTFRYEYEGGVWT